MALTFETVRDLGCLLAGVEAATKYDGTPLLKANGAFMAGMAGHSSAEPDTLVVRVERSDRQALIEEAPDTYYLTGHYRPHPVVLVRLGEVSPDALRELLRRSWQLTLARKAKRPARREF